MATDQINTINWHRDQATLAKMSVDGITQEDWQRMFNSLTAGAKRHIIDAEFDKAHADLWTAFKQDTEKLHKAKDARLKECGLTLI
jgi:hypothetical protein